MTRPVTEDTASDALVAPVDVVYSDTVSESLEVSQITGWVLNALAYLKRADAAVSIRIVDAQEMLQLNADYRQKDTPTNVLSFPFENTTDTHEFVEIDAEMANFIGDIAICDAVVKTEAVTQEKTYEQHFAHLIVHGVLHLLGFDHIDESQAAEMENNEIAILATMGFANPYLTDIKDVKNDHE